MSLVRRHRNPLVAVVVLLGAVAFACSDGGGSPTPPAVPTSSGETENVGVVFEDGTTLRGHLFGPQNEVAVVLAHMQPNDQSAWFDFAEELAENGYAALTFDFRGYGETGGDQDFDKLDEDVAEALRFMQVDRSRETVFLIGASMGGSASLVVAAERSVAGVVAVSAPGEFQGQDALGAVVNITAPKLFIGSEDDSAAAGFDDLVEAAGDPKVVEIFSGNAHGTNLLDSEHSADFRQVILDFLEEHGGS